MGYFQQKKGNEILIHATTWKNLEKSCWNERCKWSHIVGFHLYEMCRVGKSIETDIRLVFS